MYGKKHRIHAMEAVHLFKAKYMPCMLHRAVLQSSVRVIWIRHFDVGLWADRACARLAAGGDQLQL